MNRIKKIQAASLSVLVVFGIFLAIFPGAASAHGRRDLVNGKYQIVFGFLSEPAFAGQQNGIDLTVCLGKCENNADGTLKNPVLDVQKTLKAEAIFGSQSLSVTLAPRFRADGKYNGYFFPTKAGIYTLHFFGTINGDTVDEKVTSGVDGFNSVEDSTPLQFPAATSQTSSNDDKAGTALIFGIAGTVFGILGLAVGAFGLTRRNSPAKPEPEPVGSVRGRNQEGG